MQGELAFVSNVLRQSGYPDRFIAKHLEPVEPKEPVAVSSKMSVFVKLPLYGDSAAVMPSRRLNGP